MDIKIQDEGENRKKILFSLSVIDMDKHLRVAADRLSKEMTIKGFRKGAAPIDVIEKTFGKEHLWREASADAIEESYRAALTRHKINPISPPRVDITKLVPGNSFEFHAIVLLEPSFELPNYREISDEVLQSEKKIKIEVDEHEVDETLNMLANNRKGEGEEALKIDDEFASGIGAFETLEQLKESIRDGIKKEQETHRKEARRLRILEAIGAKTEIKIEEELVDGELASMQDDLEKRVVSFGMTFEDYLKKAGQTEEQLKESWKKKARSRVEASFILKSIADSEGMDPTDEEIEEQANKYLSGFDSVKEEQEKISPDVLRSYIRGMIRNSKVFNFLEREGEDSSFSEK